MKPAPTHELSLVERMKTMGLRLTGQRRVLAELLDGAADHLDAEQVYQRARAKDPSIHRATVYRALDALGEFGLVTHVHLGRAGTTYHLAGDLAPRHLHLRCSECGTVYDAPGDILESARKKVARDLGFHLAPEQVALVGVCKNCAKST